MIFWMFIVLQIRGPRPKQSHLRAKLASVSGLLKPPIPMPFQDFNMFFVVLAELLP
jgi:hypothetical protein